MHSDYFNTLDELERLMNLRPRYVSYADFTPTAKIQTNLTDSAATIMVPVPGVRKEDISVKLDDHTVTIRVADNFQYLQGWGKRVASADSAEVKTCCEKSCELLSKLVLDFEKEFLLALENGVLVISIPLKNNKKEFVWA